MASELAVVNVTVPLLAVKLPLFVQLPVTFILLAVVVAEDMVISFTLTVSPKERFADDTETDVDESNVSLKITSFPVAVIVRVAVCVAAEKVTSSDELMVRLPALVRLSLNVIAPSEVIERLPVSEDCVTAPLKFIAPSEVIVRFPAAEDCVKVSLKVIAPPEVIVRFPVSEDFVTVPSKVIVPVEVMERFPVSAGCETAPPKVIAPPEVIERFPVPPFVKLLPKESAVFPVVWSVRFESLVAEAAPLTLKLLQVRLFVAVKESQVMARFEAEKIFELESSPFTFRVPPETALIFDSRSKSPVRFSVPFTVMFAAESIVRLATVIATVSKLLISGRVETEGITIVSEVDDGAVPPSQLLSVVQFASVAPVHT